MKKYPFLTKLAGNFKEVPADARLGWEAEYVIDKAFRDIPEGSFIDCHAHLAGLGKGDTGCWVNPDVLKGKHPLDRFKLMTFINASAVEDLRFADQQYLQRFRNLVQDFPYGGKFMLLAMDKAYDKNGEASPEDSKLYVPNDIYTKFTSLTLNVISPVSRYIRTGETQLQNWKSGPKKG